MNFEDIRESVKRFLQKNESASAETDESSIMLSYYEDSALTQVVFECLEGRIEINRFYGDSVAAHRLKNMIVFGENEPASVSSCSSSPLELESGAIDVAKQVREHGYLEEDLITLARLLNDYKINYPTLKQLSAVLNEQLLTKSLNSPRTYAASKKIIDFLYQY